jgi:hypothetical protein
LIPINLLFEKKIELLYSVIFPIKATSLHCFGLFETNLFVSVVSKRVQNTKTNRKKNILVSRNKPKINQKRLCFGLFRFEPKKKICLFRGHPTSHCDCCMDGGVGLKRNFSFSYFSRKFVLTFREISLQKVSKITNVSAKTFATIVAKTKIFSENDVEIKNAVKHPNS